MVFELFQDLDRFSLDDYRPFSDIEESKNRLNNFLKVALEQQGGGIRPLESGRFSIVTGNGTPERIGPMDRELARVDDTVDLIGIDHPSPTRSVLSMEERRHLLKSVMEPMLQRELRHRGIASEINPLWSGLRALGFKEKLLNFDVAQDDDIIKEWYSYFDPDQIFQSFARIRIYWFTRHAEGR